MKISCDDGCASDLRLASLTERYNIETIFYLPVEWRSLAYDKGYKPLTWHEAKSLSEKHEIGAHTVTHRHLTKISEEDAWNEISESCIMLSLLFGKVPTKFCPPRGYSNDSLTDFTLQIYDSQRLTKGANLVHIHPDSGANGNIPWQDRYEAIKDVEGVELWCHSWELDKYNLWDELETFLKANTK